MAHKIKICLVYPRVTSPTGDPPLGLAYCAASLKATGKADVRIFDATFQPSLSRIIALIEEFDPEIVGIFVDTSMYNDAIAIANATRQRGKFIITGGPHATVMPETLIAASDIVVIGEGERTLTEIIEHYPGRDFGAIAGIWHNDGTRIVKGSARSTFTDPDTLGFPAYELLDMKSYLARWNYLDCLDVALQGTNIVGSRGCPFDCSYCQPTLTMLFGNRTRYRSAANIIAEITYLKSTYGITSFFFHDDTLTVDRGRLLSLCDMIIATDLKIFWACNTRVDTIDRRLMEKMYAAGLRKLHIGAETGSQRILDEIYHKKITTEQVRRVVKMAKEVGIRCFCFFILGAPTETRAELWQTIRFASSLPIDEASFSILTPLPGTEIGALIRSDPRYGVCSDFSRYNYHSRRVFDDPHLSSLEIKVYQVLALVVFYSHYRRWGYVLRHFTSLNGIKKLTRKVARFFA